MTSLVRLNLSKAILFSPCPTLKTSSQLPNASRPKLHFFLPAMGLRKHTPPSPVLTRRPPVLPVKRMKRKGYPSDHLYPKPPSTSLRYPYSVNEHTCLHVSEPKGLNSVPCPAPLVRYPCWVVVIIFSSQIPHSSGRQGQCSAELL